MADVDATPPVSAAPVVPPETERCDECGGSGTVRVLFNYGVQEQDCGVCAGSPVVPAATDEPALLYVIGAAIHDECCSCSPGTAECIYGDEPNASALSVVAALEANGYVVLPRKELDALAVAVAESVFAAAPGIVAAARAVVEAVGPTP